jgi:protein farnesyltransferase subunit beta
VWAPSAHAHDALRKEVYLDALSWTTDTAREDVRGGAHNRLVRLSLSVAGARMLTGGDQNATHPVFDLAMTHVEGIMGHFYGQTVPPRTA